MIHLQLLALLLVANGAPVLTTRLLGARAAWPVDFGARLPDGRRLLGDSCTYRGLAASIAGTAAAAWALGLPPSIGALVGALAMVGDAASGFVKRRLGLAPGSMALGLDQVPEALLPLLAVREYFSLSWADVLILTALFFATGLILSRIAYRLRLRSRPY